MMREAFALLLMVLTAYAVVDPNGVGKYAATVRAAYLSAISQ